MRAEEDEDKRETKPGMFLKERNVLADKSFLHAYKCIGACPSLPPPVRIPFTNRTSEQSVLIGSLSAALECACFSVCVCLSGKKNKKRER